MGLSDHEGGLLILLTSAVLMIPLNYRSRFLSIEVGGAKRFNAISWMVSFCLLTPCVLLTWMFQISSPMDCLSSIHMIFVVSLVSFAFHFYATSSCIQKCSLLFGVVQRPFTVAKEIKLGLWLKIGQYSLVQNCILILLFYGLSRVGPFRTALLSEHSDVVILAVCTSIFKGKGGPAKLRGSLFFILAIFALVLFDNDSSISEHPEGHSHHGVKHVVFYILSWMGLSDHEGGLLILLTSAVLMIPLNYRSRFLSIEVGGAKRFNAISWMVSFCLLTPCVLLTWMFQISSPMDCLSSIHMIFVVSLVSFAFHFYATSSCIQKLSTAKVAQIGTIAIFVSSLLLSFLWPQKGQTYHRVSGGAVFSLFLFSIATIQLTSPSEFFGLGREDLLPFHHLSTDAFSRSHSFFTFVNSTFHTVLADKNSRTIFYFLCINLGFTFVELIYGMWTNSLGLISDGFHMLFDCSALVMGLAASVMSHWKPSKSFPFGYGRIEVLSGFVNGLFLCVIGFMVFMASIERIFEPPPIRTERLLTVAVCGLIVNVCGILAFSSAGHGHSHGGSHGHSHHGHSHGQSLGHSQHGRSHKNEYIHSHSHSHNANMQGVFLHILADTLGSVAVIVSSFLIDWYGWLIADPICSLIFSVLILASVFPLLKNSATILLLGSPVGVGQGGNEIIEKILEVESVLSCEDPHFWDHCDDVTVATIHVFVSGDVPEQKIMRKITAILQGFGFSHVTVQIEIAKSLTNLALSAPSSWSLGSFTRVLPKKQISQALFSVSEI